MRAWLCVAVAALAVALSSAAAAEPESARLQHIKRQILAKLGLVSRPQPLRAPPRDVVRQILARAADPEPPPAPEDHETSTREIIAIAHRGFTAMCSQHCGMYHMIFSGAPEILNILMTPDEGSVANCLL